MHSFRYNTTTYDGRNW